MGCDWAPYLIGVDLIAGAGRGRDVFDDVGAGAGLMAALTGARGGTTALAIILRGADSVGVREITGCGASAARRVPDGMLGAGLGSGCKCMRCGCEGRRDWAANRS